MKIIFLVTRPKNQLWSQKCIFCKTVSGISIFGHFFCPFLRIPKYFPQKILKNLEYLIYYFKVLKDRPPLFDHPALLASN